jgi:hypothetical protein
MPVKHKLVMHAYLREEIAGLKLAKVDVPLNLSCGSCTRHEGLLSSQSTLTAATGANSPIMHKPGASAVALSTRRFAGFL